MRSKRGKKMEGTGYMIEEKGGNGEGYYQIK
jgi:hypothetical protein